MFSERTAAMHQTASKVMLTSRILLRDKEFGAREEIEDSPKAPDLGSWFSNVCVEGAFPIFLRLLSKFGSLI